jgi:hypothetical protein
MSITKVHAPIEDAEDEDTEIFYSKLEAVYDRTPRNHVKIIMGNFNAKIGKNTHLYQQLVSIVYITPGMVMALKQQIMY